MIESGVTTRADTLTANAAELAELVASFPAGSLLSSLGDEFCVTEHVCHLRDLERDGFTPRIRSGIDEDDPLLFDFDGAGVAAASNYRSQQPLDALNAFLEARRLNVEVVRNTAEDDFARVGHYQGHPPMTLDTIVTRILAHDQDHLARLRTMLQRLAAEEG